MKLKQLAFLLPFVAVTANAEDIVISTDNNALVYNVADNGRVYQKYFGKKLKNASDYASMPNGQEIYITSGMEDYYEPALHIVHADGNPSTLLTYTGHKTATLADGAKQTVISLSDKEYSDNVDVYFIVYPEHDIIKTYTTITNGEKKPIKP